MLHSFLDLKSDALEAATNNKYVDENDIRLANLSPISLFSKYKLATSIGKHIEEVTHSHIVCLMYKLKTSAIKADDLSIGFDRDRDRIKCELTDKKNQKEKFHIRVLLKDVFGYAEHKGNAKHGLGYKLKITRNTDNAVLNKANATPIGKSKINSIDWYIPNYTPSNWQQGILMNQILSKTPTVLQYVETSVFMKEVNTQSLWNFELGTQEG